MGLLAYQGLVNVPITFRQLRVFQEFPSRLRMICFFTLREK
jgi:hypothetical protein